LKELAEERHNILSEGHLGPVIVATIVSFVVGYASIAFLLKFLQRNGVIPFVVYRIILGAILLTMLQMGVIQAQSGNAPPQTPSVGRGR
jgi:undecaprenyl pyrophosphate phosphatase UppP